MKKTVILSVCMVLLLFLCMADSVVRKQRGEKNSGSYAVRSTEQGSDENMEKTEAGTDNIRVLIRSDEFASEYHDRIVVQAAQGFTVDNGKESKWFDGEQVLEILADHELFLESGVLYLKSGNGTFVLPELKRGYQNPIYQGTLEIRKTGEGMLLINELSLEQYLCGVLPSEMPADYPKEALKAQAICARTYAVKQKTEGRATEFFADVDDSVSYQVYGNQTTDERTDAAVKETAGLVLKSDGELMDAWYYSTSCGMDFSMDLSSEAVFAAFLSENQLHTYEAEEPWYRWSTEIFLQDCPEVQKISVKERNKSGRAEKLSVWRKVQETEEKEKVLEEVQQMQEEVIEGEYAIRTFLNQWNPMITLQDGSKVQGMSLFPSAFFVMQEIEEDGEIIGYQIFGGGYGHGNGMSQNGAKAIANEGKDFERILRTYYGSGVCLAKMDH